MPVPAQPEVVPSRRCDPGVERSDFILRCPQLGLRHSPLCQPQPLAPRQAVIVPVKLRMCADNLDSTSDKQRDEQEVEEVRQTNPQRKVVSGYSAHSACTVLSLACFT